MPFPLPTFLNPNTLTAEAFIIIEDDDCKFDLQHKYLKIVLISCSVTVIGFEETEYTVDESNGAVEVYVRVFNPPDNQTLPATVDLVIQTVAGSASEDTLQMNSQLLL